MRGLIAHSLQFAVHVYFMHWTFTFYADRSLFTFWNQIKYFTNFGNLNMFAFLVPFLWTDLNNLFQKKQAQYTHNSHLAYQVMTPVMMIVTFMYWLLYAINPVLLFGSKEILGPDDPLMFYLHGGNLIIMQLEHFVDAPPLIRKSQKAPWLFLYVLIYLGIYGLNYFLFKEHVYGFQEMMTPLQLVSMYITLFVILFVLDYLLSIFVYRPKTTEHHQMKNKMKI